MRISIAFPNTIPGSAGSVLIEWARQAELRGFHGVAATERLVYGGHEPMLVLAAAAAATSRISLSTNIMVGPLRPAAILAKEAATLASLSGGRFTLGVGPGVRNDDFLAAEREFSGRGATFDDQLAAIRRIWDGADPVITAPADHRVRVLIAGLSDAAVRRVVRWGDGWTAPGLEPSDILPTVAKVRSTWTEAGRSGSPRIVALARFAIGADIETEADAFIRDYFGVLGAEAESFVAKTPRSAPELRQLLAALADGGVDEVVFHPCSAELSQVHRLADIVL